MYVYSFVFSITQSLDDKGAYFARYFLHIKYRFLQSSPVDLGKGKESCRGIHDYLFWQRTGIFACFLICYMLGCSARFPICKNFYILGVHGRIKFERRHAMDLIYVYVNLNCAFPQYVYNNIFWACTVNTTIFWACTAGQGGEEASDGFLLGQVQCLEKHPEVHLSPPQKRSLLNGSACVIFMSSSTSSSSTLHQVFAGIWRGGLHPVRKGGKIRRTLWETVASEGHRFFYVWHDSFRFLGWKMTVSIVFFFLESIKLVCILKGVLRWYVGWGLEWVADGLCLVPYLMMRECIYICICMYIYMYIYKYRRWIVSGAIFDDARMYMHVYMYVCIYVYILISQMDCVWCHIWWWANVYTYVYVCIYICIYINISRYVKFYIYIHMYVCIYLSLSLSLSLSLGDLDDARTDVPCLLWK